MKPINYTISTLLYALVAVLSLILAVYFIHKNYIISIIAVLMVLVCIDNFFCSDRMCKAGFRTKGHWSLPPFLKK
jgi:hypothetical protein